MRDRIDHRRVGLERHAAPQPVADRRPRPVGRSAGLPVSFSTIEARMSASSRARHRRVRAARCAQSRAELGAHRRLHPRQHRRPALAAPIAVGVGQHRAFGAARRPRRSATAPAISRSCTSDRGHAFGDRHAAAAAACRSASMVAGCAAALAWARIRNSPGLDRRAARRTAAPKPRKPASPSGSRRPRRAAARPRARLDAARRRRS